MEDNTERYKAKIEEIFKNLELEKRLKEANKEEEQYQASLPNKSSKKRTVKAEYVDETSDKAIQEFCKRKALEELEIVREAFLEFQEVIRDLVILDQLTPQIAEFAQYAASIVELIDEDLDAQPNFGEDTQYKLAAIKKIKAQLFARLYNKYKKR
jgi:hypothetical protein